MSENKKQFIEEFIKQHGSTLRGDNLARALGYKTLGTFNRAVKAKKIPVRLYPLPVGKGRFAKTVDVAEYLWSKKQGGDNG